MSSIIEEYDFTIIAHESGSLAFLECIHDTSYTSEMT
jgi:hypothetical protein